MIIRPILPKRDFFTELTKGLQTAKVEMNLFAKAALAYMRHYPPPHHYRRTYKLHDHWKMQPQGDSVVIFNDMEYAALVQGGRRSKQGVLFKKYGWHSITDVKTQIWPAYRARALMALGIKKIPLSIRQIELQ